MVKPPFKVGKCNLVQRTLTARVNNSNLIYERLKLFLCPFSGFKTGRMGPKRHYFIRKRNARFDEFKEKVWSFKAA